MQHCRTLAFAAALLLALCSSCFAQCSLSTVKGTWGFQGRGMAMMSLPGSSTPVPVPFVSLGTMRIDFLGRYTGHGTISVGGQIQDADFAGSIKVHPDCTATESGTIGALEGGGTLVILDNGNEMCELVTKHPLGPVTETAYFRRTAPGEPQCTADMVRGVYAGPREGTQMVTAPGQAQPVAVPFSAVHTATFQSGGTGTAASTASVGGTFVDFEFPRISIAVNPDCTATMKYTGVSKQFPGQTFTGAVKYIVLNNGNELIGIDTEANTGLPAVVLDNLKRISGAPTVPDR